MVNNNDPNNEEYIDSSQEFKFEDEAQMSCVSVQNSNTNSTRPQQQKRRRTLISQSNNYESNVDTFEEAFSKHRYAGSFRLKFGRDGFSSGAHVSNADANQSLKSQVMAEDAKDTDITESYLIDSDSSGDMLIKPDDEFPQAVDQEQAAVQVPKGSANRKKQIRIFSSQGNHVRDADSFEEAFSRNIYAGSFRLRFRDEVVPRRPVNSAEATESATLVLHEDIDIQELPEPVTDLRHRQQTIIHDSESKVPEMECEKGPTTLMTAVHDDVIAAEQENITL
jgi:hypothetical protein